MNRFALALALTCALPSHGLAHTQWANGAAVPDWVKQSCCGPADANLLSPSQVHLDKDGNFHVDGGYTIPSKNVLPSQDGHYWIFHAPDCTGSNCNVFCFFAPLEF